MSKIENFFEPGDYLVEFEDCYLGCAQVEIELSPLGLEVRRDPWKVLKKRQIQSVQWSVAARLGSGDRLWGILENNTNKLNQNKFCENLFVDGGSLKLYPADPVRQGFEFPRSYLLNVKQCSGADMTMGSLELQFICECSMADQNYFIRIPAGKTPEAAVRQEVPDSGDITRELLKILAAPLAAVPDQNLRLNYFSAHGTGAFVLTMECCRNWSMYAPHTLEYALTARFPIGVKTQTDQQLMNAADFLHNYRLNIGPHQVLLCQVLNIDFSGRKSIAGNTMSHSRLDFSVLIV